MQTLGLDDDCVDRGDLEIREEPYLPASGSEVTLSHLRVL
jgi:hypothetical protein